MPRSTIIALIVVISAIVPLNSGMAIPASDDATPVTPSASIGASLVLTGHTAPVTALACSPDGTTLASSAGGVAADGAVDPTVRLWRAHGSSVVVLSGHTGAVTALAWSPDGRMLSTGARDGSARLWSAEGLPLATLGRDAGPVLSLAWSPDGTILAVGSIAQGKRYNSGIVQQVGVVRLFHPDGTLLTTLHTDGGGGKWLHLGWAPDGRTLAAGAANFEVWKPDGTLVATIAAGGEAPAMAWSPNGRLLATGNENGVVALFTSTGRPIARISSIGPIGSLAFSPNSQTLAALSTQFVRLFSSRDPGAAPVTVAAYRGLAGSVSNLAWSPDGRLLAGQTVDNVLHLWHADGTLAAVLDGCGGQINVVAWAPDGRMLAAGSRHFTVCLWGVGTRSVALAR